MRGIRTGIVIVAFALSTGSCRVDEPGTGSTEQAMVGTCTRDPGVLSGDLVACVTDVECPCGSFCDTPVGTCTYACMPADVDIPPGGFGTDAPCAQGACDDTGRCIGSGPPGTAVILGAEPPLLTTVAGGDPESFSVTLQLTNPSQSDLDLSEMTVVRVIARDGAEVSCNGVDWGEECPLTSWTFVFEGTHQEATQVAHVRTVAGTEDGHGDVVLFIDSTRAQLIVSTMAMPAIDPVDGVYAGVAVSTAYPTGVPVTARIRQQQIVVREPSRTIAPDGALLLDLNTGGALVRRRTVWLRGLGASDGEGAMVGTYAAKAASIDMAAGTIDVPLEFNIPGASGLDDVHLQLRRLTDHSPECTTSADCHGGDVCATGLQACLPPAVASPTTAAEGNQLDDARSAAWWSSIQPTLTSAAFATTGADVIESLLCSVNSTSVGRVGVAQIKQPGLISRSGDLACVDAAGPNGSPGAVGVATLADRSASSAEVVSANVLQTCLTDLARQPPAPGASFATYFGATVGKCVNFARFFPAVRLLVTDELGKSTRAELEPRGRGLLVRLTQQWTMLHGLIASTGLSQRDYDDAAVVATPPAQTRAGLVNLLDIVDRGWGALLDRRIQSSIRDAVRWSPSAEDDQSRDYRLVKRPMAYWTFGTTSYGNPALDLVRGLELVPQGSMTGAGCALGYNDYTWSFGQGFSCPGYAATFPPEAPSLVDDLDLGGAGKTDNLTITMNVDARDTTVNRVRPYQYVHYGAAAYYGGTLIATPTLAIAEAIDSAGVRSLVLAHPTAAGAELTTFTGYGQLGYTPDFGETDQSVWGSTVAVVRDARQKTYTLYVRNYMGVVLVQTKPYQQDPTGALDWVPARTVRLGSTPLLAPDHYWLPYKKPYPGFFDDVAIFDSALSVNEISRFATTRTEYGRAVWPDDMTLTPNGTQEIGTPLAALLLETQVAELEVAARLVAAVRDRVQTACDSSQVTAQADVDAVVARAGRTLRQSHLVEWLAEPDTSDRTEEARQLLRAKRIAVARALTVTRCVPPFELAEGEVPLYFNSISPQASETTAFFAASDHLLALAENRADAASAAIEAARTAYVQARQSEIQQIESDAARALRVDGITSGYGEALRRTCGIPDLSNAEIADAIIHPDPEAPFSIETCFIKPTASCLAQASGPLADADPTCFRGTLGENLMELRAAYFAQQSANQSWHAASDNFDAYAEFCVEKEKLALGPAGTAALVEAFNDYKEEAERTSKIFNQILDFYTIPFNVLGASGPLGVFKAASSFLGSLVSDGVDKRKQELDELMLRRTLQGEIAACWLNADQYQRALAAAEDSAKQALAKYEAAAIGFDNASAEGEQIMLELPIALDRELNRPSIPIAFHFWLDQRIATYDRLLATARRYTYLALRSVEYDKQESYLTAASGKPLRATVIGALHPDVLLAQLDLLRAQTANRRINGNLPSLQHLTFDLGAKFFGLPISSPQFGTNLRAHLRPVYDTAGHYMGEGMRFSFVPRPDEAPGARCAERIWRVSVGAVGFPTNDPSNMRLKMFKRNVFASRQCGASGALRAATWRPESNLFVAAGDPGEYQAPRTYTIADVGLERLDVAGALDAFRESDTAYNGSSTELSMQGLYGDYLLLIPKIALDHGLVPENLIDFNVRFDYLSGEDSAQPALRIAPDGSADPLVVDVQLDAAE